MPFVRLRANYRTGPGEWGCSPRTTCSSILSMNPGMCPVTACRSPGPNSCSRFIPASFPTVDPKSPSGAVFDRAQYGRSARCAATVVSTATKYEVFSLRFPVSSLVTKTREAASVARPSKLSLDET